MVLFGPHSYSLTHSCVQSSTVVNENHCSRVYLWTLKFVHPGQPESRDSHEVGETSYIISIPTVLEKGIPLKIFLDKLKMVLYVLHHAKIRGVILCEVLGLEPSGSIRVMPAHFQMHRNRPWILIQGGFGFSRSGVEPETLQLPGELIQLVCGLCFEQQGISNPSHLIWLEFR